MLKKIKKIFNSATEAHRAALEFGSLPVGWRLLKSKLPKGDGHPVLFFPGFLTGDIYTSQIRDCIQEQGFKTHTWEYGMNLGFDDHLAKHLKQRLLDVYAENGGQKISLVGYSLGGIYARELAREFPHMVRGVVTLGTPFGKLDDLDNATAIPLEKIYSLLHPEAGALTSADIGPRSLTPPPVPTTSIYSRSDGVVNWQASLNPNAKQAENIEVFGSHMGMTFNPMTIAAVVDRLAQPEGTWQKFDPARLGISMGFPKSKNPDVPKNPCWGFGRKKEAHMFPRK